MGALFHHGQELVRAITRWQVGRNLLGQDVMRRYELHAGRSVFPDQAVAVAFARVELEFFGGEPFVDNLDQAGRFVTADFIR